MEVVARHTHHCQIIPKSYTLRYIPLTNRDCGIQFLCVHEGDQYIRALMYDEPQYEEQ